MLASLGSKVSTPSVFSINEVRPPDVELKKDNLIYILGSNFEKEMGTVWIEYYRPLEEYLRVIYQDEEKQKEIRYTRDRFKYQYKPEIGSWEDNRIIVKLDDEVISKLDKDINLEAADLVSYDGKKSELSKAEYEIRNIRSGTKNISTFYKSKGNTANAAITFGDQNEYDTKRREYEKIKTKLDENEYVMRVEKKGLLTYANGDATFRFYRASKSLNDTKSNILKLNLGPLNSVFPTAT
jgi:hypothetical protein